MIKKIKSWLKPFVLKHFAPDYEDVKNRNKQLTEDIHKLVMEEGSIETESIRISWATGFKFEETMTCGSSLINNSYKGLINQIEND